MKAILIVGDIVDGLRFFGPFESKLDATAFAKAHVTDQWDVTDLEDQKVWLAQRAASHRKGKS
jgi:hypothetical protein